jgi:hypothetical protein
MKLCGIPAADAVCAGLQLIQHATSLGAVESTIERRASIPRQEHLPPALLRLSVGIDSVVTTTLFRRRAAISFSRVWKAKIYSVGGRRT